MFVNFSGSGEIYSAVVPTQHKQIPSPFDLPFWAVTVCNFPQVTFILCTDFWFSPRSLSLSSCGYPWWPLLSHQRQIAPTDPRQRGAGGVQKWPCYMETKPSTTAISEWPWSCGWDTVRNLCHTVKQYSEREQTSTITVYTKTTSWQNALFGGSTVLVKGHQKCRSVAGL